MPIITGLQTKCCVVQHALTPTYSLLTIISLCFVSLLGALEKQTSEGDGCIGYAPHLRVTQVSSEVLSVLQCMPRYDPSRGVYHRSR